MLLITDVLKRDSLLLTNGNALFEQNLIFEKLAEGEFSLPDILSRKKQLLPEVMRVISL